MTASHILLSRGSGRREILRPLPSRGDAASPWQAAVRMIVLMLALSSVSACTRRGGDGAKKPPPPLVGAAPALSHVFSEDIETIGTARANEQVTLAANVTERVDRLLFDDGMIVRRGQLLAVLSHSQE